jgi:hypothetical protein
MSNDKGATGSDAGWENTQTTKSFNKDKVWEAKSDNQVNQDIQDRKDRRKNEETFKNYHKPPREKGYINDRLNLFEQSKFAKHTGKVNRTHFTDKVLMSSKAKKNIGYTSTEFNSLSLDEQNKVFSKYMSNRMEGKTDAYGNAIGGWRQEDIKHKNKDGTYTTKSVWMGGNENNTKTYTVEQIAKQNETGKITEEEDTRTEEEKEEDYKKVKGLKGSRSLFGNAGGRGYFDPA